MSLIYLTTHGILRARQRCGWAESALHRMLDRILAFGAVPGDCPGALRRWLGELTRLHPQREFRVYGNHVFIFQPEPAAGWHFITVLHVPQEYRHAWGRLAHR